VKVWFWKHKVVLVKEEDDIWYYGAGGKGESRLLYHLKQFLNERGFDLIKTRMWKDYHLVDDTQQYVRARYGTKAPHIYIWSTFYAIHGIEVPWNSAGTVSLGLGTDIWDKDQDTVALIKALCEEYDGIEWRGE